MDDILLIIEEMICFISERGTAYNTKISLFFKPFLKILKIGKTLNIAPNTFQF